MKIILYIIYHFLKGIVLLTLGLFYRRVKVLDRERLRLDKGPYILVSNHPNTLIDPLQTAMRVRRMVYFLANAGLYKTPFQNWFFSTFYCIRIERPTDVGGRPIKNDKSFALCGLHLGKGGVLYIAPEAYSFKGRKLLPLKTGTMRIALSAERKQQYKLGLKILPVGINYESPYDFRSDILIRVGAPLSVNEYAEEYEKDPFGSVRRLTGVLEERMRSLILHTNDETEDQLLGRLEEILQNNNRLSLADRHFRSQKLLSALQVWREKREENWMEWAREVETYFETLNAADLSDRHIARPGSCKLLRRSFLALISLPVFLYGWLNNYLPAWIPAWLVRKLQLAEEYDATVKTISGLITFPLFYFFQYQIVKLLLPPPYPFWYLLSLIPLGFLAWELKKYYDQLRFAWRFQRFCRQKPDEVRALTKQRAQIVEAIPILL